VFVIHEVTAVRAIIQGAHDATIGSTIGTILQSSADQECPREERPRTGIADHALK